MVEAVDLSVGDGELVALLGPNGSGKTTLLRAIAGFQPTTAGSVSVGGRAVERLPPHRRGIGILFQEPALFLRRTVFENVAYGPQLARRPRAEIDREVESLAALLALGPLLDRPAQELSGGERQRVALARTLAARPGVVLLDEPFASVDPELRAELHGQFRRALRERGAAAVHVTHDREEGLFLGDRVALLFDGRLAALGAPRDVFEHPADERTARFLGYNVLDVDGDRIAVLPEDLSLEPPSSGRPGYTVLATGPVGRGYRAVLGGRDGRQLEVRGPAAWPETGTYALRWSRSVRLRS